MEVIQGLDMIFRTRSILVNTNHSKVQIYNSNEQYLLMKINLIQTIIGISLISIATALHLQQGQKPYDPNQYYNSLSNMQTQVKSDLSSIQKQFAQIDQSLKKAIRDPYEQLRILQQGIADQRDSLYTIQQYLTLPFNERSCKCLNFTQQLRQTLSIKIAEVEKSLNKIDLKRNQCSDCKIDNEIENQIEYQKNYLKIMKDTINSKCCTIFTILFKDNVNAANWFCDNCTLQWYQKWIDSKLQNLTSNKTIIKQCPSYAPYSFQDFKSCSTCSKQSQFYNLKTRKCEPCPTGKLFNYNNHSCDYNIICPPGSKFNQQTVQCQKIQPAYNNSLCPPDAPIWNPITLGCSKCSVQTPYFDSSLKKCTTCPLDYQYKPQINQCVYKACEIDQTYNKITKRCQKKSKVDNQKSNSNCPPEKPFWDKSSLSCSKCPNSSPFYNINTKNCESCPTNSTFDPSRNICIKSCPFGQILNLDSLKCEKKNVNNNSGQNQLSMCPPNKPIWNSETKSCSECNAQTPYWNIEKALCQKCPIDQNWNQTLRFCQKKVAEKICPQETKFNPDTGECDLVGGFTSSCPPDKPFYNKAIMSCQKCPISKPYYNIKTNSCQSQKLPEQIVPIAPICPDNFTYDNLLKICKSSTGKQKEAICPPDSPIWNSIIGTCTACPSGQRWDSASKICVKCSTNEQCSSKVVNKTCDFNYEWSTSQSKCRKCLAYQKYNNDTKLCQNFCKIGQVYNSNYQICSGTISRCPLGLIYNNEILGCQCSQGRQYKYDQQNRKCTKQCNTGEYYDNFNRKCYPI